MNKKIIIVILSVSLSISVAYNIHQKNTIKKLKEPIKNIVNMDSLFTSEICNQEKELFDITKKIETFTCSKKRTEQDIMDINYSFYKYPCYLRNTEEIKNWEKKYVMDENLIKKLKELNRKKEYLDSLLGKLNIQRYFLSREITNKKSATYSKFSNHIKQLKIFVKETNRQKN